MTYGTVISPYTGRIWLDRNLGASRVCTSIDDNECIGDYYQWGREADGHEKADSETTDIKATDITNVGNKFIIVYDHNDVNWDWTTADTNDTLRQSNWSKTDGTSICPLGYRVPTAEELTLETIDHGVTNVNTAFNSFLKIANTNERFSTYGLINGAGQLAILWSTTPFYSNGVTTTYIRNFIALSSDAHVYQSGASNGIPVRCIKD